MALNSVSMKRKASTLKAAFTLIELLIVVAIIAILAAIAVPNFLEAQVRAKVSRAKADMRTLATAIEAYTVDNNKMPLSTADGAFGAPPTIYSNPNTLLKYSWMVTVTSPVAYITTIPQDSFGGQANPLPGDLRFFFDYRRMVKGKSFTQKTTLKEVSTGLGPTSRNDPAATADSWLFWSPGPDKYQNINSGLAPDGTTQVYGFGDPLGLWCVYDATNGTVSWGDIIRSSYGDEKAITGL